MSPARERLAPEDGRILRLESAAIAGHTMKVVVLERPGIDRDALCEHVAERVPAVPRCRQRLTFAPRGLGPPWWVDDPDFDIDHHVGQVPVAGHADEPALREVLARLMERRLDRSRPLWRLDLVGPLAGGGSALVLTAHHCMADGTGILRMGDALLWGEAPVTTAPVPASPSEPPGTARLLADSAAERVAGAATAAARAARAAGSASVWRSAAREAVRAPRAIHRELAPRAGGSPLAARVGPRRRVAFASAPLDQLKAIEHAAGAGVTVNDVLLAAVAGGVRTWLLHRHGRPGSLRVQVPVSMHAPDEAAHALGNRDSSIFVDLPLDDPDPMRRLLRINAETRERKAQDDPGTIFVLFDALSHVPPLYRAAERLAGSPHVFGLNVSNVPGPREPISVAGTRVRELRAIAEVGQRHALRVSALSLAGMLSIGLCADADVVPDLDTLAGGIERAVAELSGAGGSSR